MAAGPVLVVDFGAQYAQLIARRVREANVYSELVPHSMPVDEMLAKDPQAIILSGGPASVFEPGAPRVDKKLFEAGVPVLGICYGFQAMAYALGANVDKAALGEYGKTETFIDKSEGLLEGSPADQNTWMSHGVAVKTAPEGFEVLAHTEGAPVAAMQDESRKLYGVQWHPEVKHTPMGQQLIETFLHKCAGLGNNWDASSIIEDQVAKIREKVGDAQVICGLSGGVDSAVAAALVHKAIGDQLTCVFVDHGLLRKGEAEQVKHDFVEATGIKLIAVDASEDFLTALKGVSEPEKKRKIIGEKFIRTFEKAQRQVIEEAGASGKEVKFLVQGTLYPDVVESGGGDGAANIKSHHNVGGLPDDIKFQLVEPLRTLFKDEVRAIGTELGLHVPCSRMRFVPSVPSLDCRTKSSGVSRSLARASASASSARSPRNVWIYFARPTPSLARSFPRLVLTAISGSARSCSLPMCIPWACKATSVPTVRRSCFVRFLPKTP